MQKRSSSRWLWVSVVLVWFLVPASAQEGRLKWNTFQGSFDNRGEGITADDRGFSYITGATSGQWDGSHVRDHGGGAYDAVVACFDPEGHMRWHTFLGGDSYDYGYGIIYAAGRLYVAGDSDSSWGSDPVRAYTGDRDGWVAVLNADTGVLIWHTFLGGGSLDTAEGIAGGEGRIYVTGYSYGTWGSDPVRDYSGGADGWAAALNIDTGALHWNTFLGGSGDYDLARRITTAAGRVYASGNGVGDWGITPVRGYTAGTDAWVAALDAGTGVLNWYTFLGGDGYDYGGGVAASADRLYANGVSTGTWGSLPARDYSGSADGWIASLDPASGVLGWHTFLGGASDDYSYAIIFSSGLIYAAGWSYDEWGSHPIRSYAGSSDGFVAAVDADSGLLEWNTFLGGADSDENKGIAVTPGLALYVCGHGESTWGDPVHEYGGSDILEIYTAAVAQTASHTIRARVAGGHGMVSPEQQSVTAGGDATVEIDPDPGYRAVRILDNGESVPVASPYVIENVQEFHEVVVSFGPDYVLPTIGLAAQRKSERAWVIQKDFGDITVTITEDAANPAPVARYILYRSGSNGTVQIAVYTDAGTHTFQDKYLEKDQIYTYQVTAVDGKGSVIATSNEAEI